MKEQYAGLRIQCTNALEIIVDEFEGDSSASYAIEGRPDETPIPNQDGKTALVGRKERKTGNSKVDTTMQPQLNSRLETLSRYKCIDILFA